MMTIILKKVLTKFNTYDFNLDSHTINHILIMFLRIILHFSISIYTTIDPMGVEKSNI